ncbi:hypothetical protein FE392_04005 [Xenorhabdus sp. 12]|uniref:Phage coat protein n=1 Tax=Xenorhabdus santafensis TaxID=2582833 RepID=A0ABU4S5M1_9GAMM|nr:hypothetical protein [Xenorhabdus sp. 12]MDX7986500.1 hypothetical protein [Xenorhabdus sp. 12]
MNIKNIVSSAYLKSGLLAVSILSSSAFAAEGEPQNVNYFAMLAKQIDVAPIITGVVSVAGTVMGVAVVVMGIKKVARMLNSF